MYFGLSTTNEIVSSKIYDTLDELILKYNVAKFPFLGGDVPRSFSYGVYIPQLIRFVKVCSNDSDFNNRNQYLTAKFLIQGY